MAKWRLQVDPLGEEDIPSHLRGVKAMVDEAIDVLNRDGDEAEYVRADPESGLTVLLSPHGQPSITIGYTLPKDEGSVLAGFVGSLGAKTFNHSLHAWITFIPLVKD